MANAFRISGQLIRFRFSFCPLVALPFASEGHYSPPVASTSQMDRRLQAVTSADACDLPHGHKYHAISFVS